MAPWVMHSEVRHRPWCLTFYIGQIAVAEIRFENKKPMLYTWGTNNPEGPFATVSEAMKRMHEMLNQPPIVLEGPRNDDER